MEFYGSTGNGPLYGGEVMSTDPGEGWEPRYRSTIVPREEPEHKSVAEGKTTGELLAWLAEYGSVNGIQDIKDIAAELIRRLK